MQIEIWSDVVCPWCHIGKRNLESALSAFGHGQGVEVVWRSFELDPRAPAEHAGDYAGRLASKYGVAPDEAVAMLERVTAAAARVGLSFRFDIARPGNTFDAHRVLHLAAERGRQDPVKERLLEATFSLGLPIGDHATLVEVAAGAGLDAGEVRRVLEDGTYADQVRSDERRAAALGITSVPFFVIDGAYGLSGAQPPEVLGRALDEAWASSHPLTSVVAGGPTCDDGSCRS